MPFVTRSRRCAVVAVCLAACVGAQESLPAGRAETRPAIPTPEEYLGRPLGAVWTRHSDVLGYAKLVASRSDRVRYESYGRTYEGRELALVVASAPENLGERFAAHRARAAKLADPRLLAPGEDVAPLMDGLPAVVWLSFNVHGNEPSPSETFLRVLHRLATDDGPENLRRLRESYAVMDPCVNPDGRDRYVNWFNSCVGSRPDPDPLTREHKEPWPGGRQNHFQFDLNRDWAFATQVETRARHRKFLEWTPQVHADYHEMSAETSYFFFPAEKPINANVPPSILKWGKLFGDGNAAAFDREGFAYYTGEDFDLFYPGYGDSWPSLTGAIGMTYEMAGHSTAGTAYRRRDGAVLTLNDRIRRHELTALATIDTAVVRRAELLADWHGFRRTAVEEGRGGSPRAFLLDVEDPARADALVDTLLAQGIEVHRATADFVAQRLKDVHLKPQEDRTFAAGTYVVRLDQPLKRLAKTLLEPRTEIRELYFYDVSAWSLPLGYGVPCFETEQPVSAPLERVTAVAPRAGGVAAGDASVGWLLDGARGSAAFALCDLLREGVRVRVARKEFTLGETAYARGALLVRRAENGPDVAERLARIGAARGAAFKPTATGRVAKGADLGSDHFAPVAAPRVVLVAGDGVDTTSFGAARFLLDRTYDAPYSVVNFDDVRRIEPGTATAIVYAEGRFPRDKETVAALRAFMERGGVVVALGGAAFGACGGEDALSAVKAGPPPAPEGASKPTTPPRRKLIEEREHDHRLRQAPGSFFLVELDPAHPLSFGYRGDLAAFKAGLVAFDPTGPGEHVGVFKDASPLSGYVNPEDEKGLRGRSYVTVEEHGRGALVLFADDPNFRGGWHGLSRLFLNACLLLPATPAR